MCGPAWPLLPFCEMDAAWYDRGEQSRPVISPLWKLISFSGALRCKKKRCIDTFMKELQQVIHVLHTLNIVTSGSINHPQAHSQFFNVAYENPEWARGWLMSIKGAPISISIAYSVRDDYVYLPYSSPSVLGVPESGRVHINTTRESLQANVMMTNLHVLHVKFIN